MSSFLWNVSSYGGAERAHWGIVTGVFERSKFLGSMGILAVRRQAKEARLHATDGLML